MLPTFRAFLALDLSESAREDAAALQSELRQRIDRQGVKWVDPAKFHLTLVFLGQVPSEEVEALAESVRQASQALSALELATSELGSFPGPDRPAVLWLGIESVRGSISDVQSAIANVALPWTERPDEKAFHAHLTLARVSPPSRKVGLALQRLPASLRGPAASQWIASEVVLYRTCPDGSYEQVAAAPLKGS